MPSTKAWWERVRDHNRSLKGLISARRRYAARMDRLEGKQPKKRMYSVPAIARRIGTTLPYLKRVIRGQEAPPPALVAKLARDLDIPAAELKSLFGGEQRQSPTPVAARGGAGPSRQQLFQALEQNLVNSARAFVELLRSCAEQGERAPRRSGPRQKG